MEVRLRLPPEIRDLFVENDKMYILVPDAVYEASIKNLNNFKEIVRWTGAQLLSISSHKNRIIVGTDRGVLIIMNGKPYPLWTGSPTLVSAGNFTDEHNFFLLAEKVERGITTPNLFVPFTISEDEIVESKRATSKVFGEITMFPAAASPFKGDIIQFTKRLTKVIDIDFDGYDEIIMTALEESKPQLAVVKVKKREENILRLFPILASPTAFPIVLEVGDIDMDSIEEPLILLRRRNDFFQHILVAMVVNGDEKNIDMTPIIIGEINLHDMLKDHIDERLITDDTDIFLLAGNIDADGLPEIILLVYYPPFPGKKEGILIPVKIDVAGRMEVLDIINIFPIKTVISGDVDNDGQKEAILLSHFGFTILDFGDEKGDKKNPNMREYYLPAVMRFFIEKDKNFIVAGPVILGSKKYSFIDLAERSINIIEIANILKFRRGINSFVAVKDSGTLLFYTESGIAKYQLPDIKDIFMYGSDLYVFTKDKVIMISKDGKRKIIDSSKTPINIGKYESGRYYKILYDGKSILLSRGMISLIEKDGSNLAKYKLNYALSDVLCSKDGCLIRTRSGELYFINMVANKIIKAELSNVVGLNLVNNKLQLSFENNWIVDYKFSEVFSQ